MPYKDPAMARAARLRYRARHPEKVSAERARHYVRHRERLLAYSKRYATENSEKVHAAVAAWRQANPEAAEEYRRNNAEAIRISAKEYAIAHPAKVRAKTRKYQATKLQRTPSWVDLKKIEKVYEDAQRLTFAFDEPFHVDHVIPLRGKLVSGLHVHTNLQILPGQENLRKHNHFEV